MLDRAIANVGVEEPGEIEPAFASPSQQTAFTGEPSDESLAARLLGRDLDAFTRLYDRHIDLIYGLAVYMLGHAEAEEAVQEVFLRLWKKREQYQPARGAFRPWLLSVARNHCLDILRRRGLQRRLLAVAGMEEQLAALEDIQPDVAEQTWQHQRAVAVRSALSSIPDEQRQVIILAFFGGLSQSMIARELGAPLGTVKKRARLGMQKLRASLEQMGLFEGETPARKGIGK